MVTFRFFLLQSDTTSVHESVINGGRLTNAVLLHEVFSGKLFSLMLKGSLLLLSMATGNREHATEPKLNQQRIDFIRFVRVYLDQE